MSHRDGIAADGLTPESLSSNLVPTKSLTVVLPSYHRLPQLAETLNAYLSQGPDEVVVVLDGPHPECHPPAPPFTDPRVRVVELPENRGLALARIAGLNAASGDIVLLADDDVVPCPGLISGHRRYHEDKSDLVVVGYMPVGEPGRRRRNDGHTVAYRRYYEQVVAGWERSPATVLTSIWGGNISIDADLYRRVEIFRPSVRISYFEDHDLGIRCERLGASAVFDRHLLAEHRHHVTFEGRLRQVQSQGEAIQVLSERWGGLPDDFRAWLENPWRNLGWRTTSWISTAVVHAGYKLSYRILGSLHLWPAQDRLIDIAEGWLVFSAYATASSPKLRPR